MKGQPTLDPIPNQESQTQSGFTTEFKTETVPFAKLKESVVDLLNNVSLIRINGNKLNDKEELGKKSEEERENLSVNKQIGINQAINLVIKEENNKHDKIEYYQSPIKSLKFDPANSIFVEGRNPKLCKICYDSEETEKNKMINPCTCQGSMKFVHQECIKKWVIQKNPGKYTQIKCEICKFPLKFKTKQQEVVSRAAFVHIFQEQQFMLF